MQEGVSVLKGRRVSHKRGVLRQSKGLALKGNELPAALPEACSLSETAQGSTSSPDLCTNTKNTVGSPVVRTNDWAILIAAALCINRAAGMSASVTTGTTGMGVVRMTHIV